MIGSYGKVKELNILRPLTKDEMGKLYGGFSAVHFEVKTRLGATNSNCAGGGWFDSNINCTGMCTACKTTGSTTTQPGKPIIGSSITAEKDMTTSTNP